MIIIVVKDCIDSQNVNHKASRQPVDIFQFYIGYVHTSPDLKTAFPSENTPHPH